MQMIGIEWENFLKSHASEEPEVLKLLARKTHSDVLMPRMLSGHLQGRWLAMISQLVKPKRILEIGTYTGYSAICLAEGLAAGGQLITIDINEELADLVNEFVQKAGFSDRITQLTGPAADIIPSLDGPFDMVFIDADKALYPLYYDLVFDKVATGGLILVDNVAWDGKVLEPEKHENKETKGIMALLEKVRQDDRVEPLILPIRDGILTARKK